MLCSNFSFARQAFFLEELIDGDNLIVERSVVISTVHVILTQTNERLADRSKNVLCIGVV